MLSFLHALRMALTSACDVGSCSDVTRLTPVAIISPSRAITAPNGPPPLAMFSMESSMAFLISSFLVISVMMCRS